MAWMLGRDKDTRVESFIRSFCDGIPYSARRATIGSTFVARRAGM
jgi:hypothetical protein